MNDLFEEMKNNYEIFCRSAQQFMDAVKEQNTPKAETPDYNSWIGKVVYVWDDDPDDKKKAILLDYADGLHWPFLVAGRAFKNAELCED